MNTLFLGMLKIKHLVENLVNTADSNFQDLSVDDLKREGLKTLVPHDYQLFGINWLTKCERKKNGGVIVGDEMGLGKTLQVCPM